MSNIDMNKLVYLVTHQNCQGIRCHTGGKELCPLYETTCHRTLAGMSIQEKITIAMEHYGITKADLMTHLVGKEQRR